MSPLAYPPVKNIQLYYQPCDVIRTPLGGEDRTSLPSRPSIPFFTPLRLVPLKEFFLYCYELLPEFVLKAVVFSSSNAFSAFTCLCLIRFLTHSIPGKSS